MKNILVILSLLFLMACIGLKNKQSTSESEEKSAAVKTISDNWYSIVSEKETGYAHYLVQDQDSVYKLSYESKYKENTDSTVYYTTAKLSCLKDDFLSVKTFELRFNSGRRTVKSYYLKGYVETINTQQKWVVTDAYQIVKSKGEQIMVDLPKVKREFSTEAPVITDLNMLHFISQQNFATLGGKIPFNTMEMSRGPKYRKNTFIEYTATDTLSIEGENISTKKIIYGDEKNKKATFWLGNNSVVLQYNINGRTTLKCVSKEKINLDSFKR